MPLRGRHEFQPAVLVLVVVPLHELMRPSPCLLDAFKWLARRVMNISSKLSILKFIQVTATMPVFMGRERMALAWIVKGDKTTHGGEVLEGERTYTVDEKPVALVGHLVSCPKCKGGPFPIATGAPNFRVHDRALARHGDETACGAKLVSSQRRATWSRKGLVVVHAAAKAAAGMGGVGGNDGESAESVRI
jgi:uncharacterized Zn-binding protein involved in type VI secretion